VALYLAGGVVGALLSAVFHPSYFEGVGASGAVYALEACNCLLQPQRQLTSNLPLLVMSGLC